MNSSDKTDGKAVIQHLQTSFEQYCSDKCLPPAIRKNQLVGIRLALDTLDSWAKKEERKYERMDALPVRVSSTENDGNIESCNGDCTSQEASPRVESSPTKESFVEDMNANESISSVSNGNSSSSFIDLPQGGSTSVPVPRQYKAEHMTHASTKPTIKESGASFPSPVLSSSITTTYGATATASINRKRGNSDRAKFNDQRNRGKRESMSSHALSAVTSNENQVSKRIRRDDLPIKEESIPKIDDEAQWTSSSEAGDSDNDFTSSVLERKQMSKNAAQEPIQSISSKTITKSKTEGCKQSAQVSKPSENYILSAKPAAGAIHQQGEENHRKTPSNVASPSSTSPASTNTNLPAMRRPMQQTQIKKQERESPPQNPLISLKCAEFVIQKVKDFFDADFVPGTPVDDQYRTKIEQSFNTSFFYHVWNALRDQHKISSGSICEWISKSGKGLGWEYRYEALVTVNGEKKVIDTAENPKQLTLKILGEVERMAKRTDDFYARYLHGKFSGNEKYFEAVKELIHSDELCRGRRVIRRFKK